MYLHRAAAQRLFGFFALKRRHVGDYLQPRCFVPGDNAQDDKIFYIEVRLTADGETSCTVIEDFHTHITRVEHNGVQQPLPHCGEAAQEAAETDRSHMTVEGILEYAETVDLEEVRFLLEHRPQQLFLRSTEFFCIDNDRQGCRHTLVSAAGNNAHWQRRGVRHCMAGRRRLRGDCPYHRQRACNFVRYGV